MWARETYLGTCVDCGIVAALAVVTTGPWELLSRTVVASEDAKYRQFARHGFTASRYVPDTLIDGMVLKERRRA